MARTISTLPEELVLRVFDNLERLNDLYAVMLTCKQFNRISQTSLQRRSRGWPFSREIISLLYDLSIIFFW